MSSRFTIYLRAGDSKAVPISTKIHAHPNLERSQLEIIAKELVKEFTERVYDILELALEYYTNDECVNPLSIAIVSVHRVDIKTPPVLDYLSGLTITPKGHSCTHYMYEVLLTGGEYIYISNDPDSMKHFNEVFHTDIIKLTEEHEND